MMLMAVPVANAFDGPSADLTKPRASVAFQVPPSADAGPDQTVTLVDVALLVGAASALAALGVIQRNDGADENDVAPLRFARPAAYIAGSLAAYWMIDRVAGFVV